MTVMAPGPSRWSGRWSRRHDRAERWGSAGDVVEGVRVGTGALAAVQAGEGGHVLGAELEVEQREVLLHALAGDRLGEDDVPALHVPPQHDLGRGAAQP